MRKTGCQENREQTDQPEVIFGRNPILSYLEEQAEKAFAQNKSRTFSPVSVNKLFIAAGLRADKRIDRIKHLAAELKIPVVSTDRHRLDQMVQGDHNHQGLVAQINPHGYLSLAWLLAEFDTNNDNALKENRPGDFVVAILDGIEDPHNLGAIARVCEAAGVKALILPDRRCASVTSGAVKTSAGAFAHLPVVRVKNLVDTLKTLKESGFWIAGLSPQASDYYYDCNLNGPLAIILGSEGDGIKRLVSENCDLLLKIPMLGKTESLNASVAAGIVFYEIVRQRRQPAKQKD